MIQTGFESRVKIQQIIDNQLPEFILDESPKASEFLKQYYVSQEYQGGPVDIAENLDQYLKLDNLVPEVIVGAVGLSTNIDSTVGVITVTSTKGFPQKYGLFKIDDEIITYTGITTNTFTGCIRGFSGITSYHAVSDQEELVFSTSKSAEHTSRSSVQNLSSLFLKEFYKKIKFSLTPGLENNEFVSDLNVGNFIKNARSFYQSKGTNESFRILFNVLYGITPKVVNLEDFLLKPSAANYVRRTVVSVEKISGDPSKLIGQTIVKSTDPTTSASVSEVEIFTKKNVKYYKLLLFIGNDNRSSIEGNFTITPNTKCLENIAVGSSVISVDSTIGFKNSGTIISGNNIITYTDKSINQFLGCSGIIEQINVKDNIRSDETYYGYENGNINKKVEFRISGVISKFVPTSNPFKVSEGQQIIVKNIGDEIKNPTKDQTQKEIFANSWIYNTSCRYQVKLFGSGGSVTLESIIDKSSLKEGDEIEILERGTGDVKYPQVGQNTLYVSKKIESNSNIINLNNFTTDGWYENGLDYDLRRKLNKASSTIIPIEYGNDVILSDIQNVYSDVVSGIETSSNTYGNDKYMYVASNSLPSNNKLLNVPYAYQITKNVNSAFAVGLSGLNDDNYYTTINCSTPVPFITGDKIYYDPESTQISGLSTGYYYVEVLSPNNTIKLYSSLSFVGKSNNILFQNSDFSNDHKFVLYSQKSSTIKPQKLLRKFPLNLNIQNGLKEETVPGSTGILINGVEIKNYKLNDRVYYGPLESVTVLNGGENYDVINPPLIEISSGLGITALVQPVVSGSIKKVFVDYQDFDIDTVISIGVSGGNGSGAVLRPIIKDRVRDIYFDGRLSVYGGGVDYTYDTITFLKDHYLSNGQKVTYNSNGNTSIGIGQYSGSNSDQNLTLVSNGTYYVKVQNSKTITLYPTLSNYNSGINTVGFTNVSNSGIHKFFIFTNKRTLSEVKVINGGSGYQNRKLIVNSSGISTTNYTINFNNHGFNDGDIIEYDYQISSISGLSTTEQYYVLRSDENSFRLCNAGAGGTDSSNYNQKKYIKLSYSGSGYHYFKYPNISVSVIYSKSGISSEPTQIESLVLNPSVKGNIIDTYLYEPGSNYGSENVLNLHKKPLLSIKNGKEARIKPIIVNGLIDSINIQYGGVEYYSTPDLFVVDTSKSGVGADLRAIVKNGKIIDVSIINPGIGYSSGSTYIQVIPLGQNAKFDLNVRSLRVNANKKFGDEFLIDNGDGLQYSVCGYLQTLRTSFKDIGSNHSPLIGWAYDGNPIYGSYGYSDPGDINSGLKQLKSGYVLNSNNITNRPSSSIFPVGFFVEDYVYNNSGDLDENNGRFTKTPEYPNGIYAYFAPTDSGTFAPQFPYFIGDSYRSNSIKENITLDQSFDFNNSNLVRNTLPYKVSDYYADNDFIIESNEVQKQKSIINSVTTGYVDEIDILNSGINYKINDLFKSDDTNTSGGGLSVKVSSIKGNDITNLSTEVEKYNNAIFTWKNENQVKVSILPGHKLTNNDNVIISGFSTSLSELNGSYSIGISSYHSNLIKDIPPQSSGVTTDIYLAQIPELVSIGSSIIIESETLSVIKIFKDLNILKVQRGLTGVSHTSTTQINFVPDSFIINQKTTYFDSTINDKVYFNPKTCIGVGTQSGITSSINTNLGINTITITVPTQGIYIENHPFKNNQQVVFSKLSGNPIAISTSPTGFPADQIPYTGNSQIVYLTNKGNNVIGIKTGLDYPEVFFLNDGSGNYTYSLTSNYNQILGQVNRVKTVVLTSTDHELSNNDKIKLKVNPNLSVGIGTSSSVYVKRDITTGNILINSLGFSSTGISTITNTITINSHKLNTGNKIHYSSEDKIASGLSTGTYFVYKVGNDDIKLSETYSNSISTPPITVDIVSIGGTSQYLSLINPQIKVVKDNNLVFNLSDSSLSGYNLKLYYDKDFKNEFVSTGSTSTFVLTGIGTIGISSTASVTLQYSDKLPTKLFYNLEKSGDISNFDNEVNNYSEILFIDSDYNGNYAISGIGSTSFTIFLEKNPEKLTYSQNECKILEYSTNSLSAKGPINKVNIVSGGTGYKKLPVFIQSNSKDGKDAYIIPKSKTIGNPKEITIIDEGFDYSCDKTLEPTAYISPQIKLNNSNTISNIIVLEGGKNYTNAPSVVIVDPNTGKKIDSGILEAKLTSNSITNVVIKQKPKGLPLGAKLFTVNNDNGISIQKIESSSSGIFTCLITTPTLGFTTNPFNIGDKVFIEGIEKEGDSGSGFNSEDYGYQFFKVTNYDSSSIFDKVEINITGLTTNTGIAKTFQYSFPNIVNYNNYPNFEVIEESLSFIVGEKIISNGIERDLYIETSDKNSITVSGKYELSVGEVIYGNQSGNIATINEIESSSGKFKVNFSLNKNIGWADDVGKLNQDNQFISDNDYYQNLSYTIKSPITYNELKGSVNNLVHTIGLKNFSDTGITSTAKVNISHTQEYINIIKTLIQENRVDAINDFDLVQDVDVNNGTSKFLKLKNKKLSKYIECNTNLVLKIDDIHSKFSNLLSSPSIYSNLFKIDSTDDYNRLLIRVTDSSNTKIQLTELIVLNNNLDSFILQKGSLFNVGAGFTYSNGEEYGTFSSVKDAVGDRYIQFLPTNPYDYDYDIKLIKNKFNSSAVGVASTSVGFVNLISSGLGVTSGITSSIISIPKYKIESLCANVEIIDEITGQINFVELYLTHDGITTAFSQYSFDSNSTTNSYSSDINGLFDVNTSSGMLTLTYTNTSENSIKLKSKIVGFGTVSVGMGTYRFKLPGQISGYERSAKYESKYSSNVSVASSVISLDKNDFNAVKSLVKVSVGSTNSLHQVSLIQDKNNIYVQQSAFLSVGSIAGIGTFGGEYNGNNFSLKFYPDANISNINILSFNECLYTEIDEINVPPGLYYGNVAESVEVAFYNAINGDRINRKDFDLTYGGFQYEIFAKNFDPSNSNILNPATGEFTIKNHFFSNGEKLIYTPKSTYLGIGASSIGIGLTLTSAGIVTNRLPSDVYAIKTSNDTFKLSTRKDYALVGIYVTFTSYGLGNYHQLEMYEKNSKSIITIDNIIQYPLICTPIKYTLSNNGGQINDSSKIFSLSGISSISPKNILRIDNEYMVINSVGFGTTNVGPITNSGSIPLVQVDRGAVGSSATSHSDTVGIVTIYKGSYNIVGNKIFFAESPRGNPQIIKDFSYLDYQTSTFNGRVYLRQDYTTNKVYDDISSEFTGVGRTFALKVQGDNAVGLGTSGGNGIVLINGIYQTPTTDNNPSNNFRITENGSTSSNLIFSGITDENGVIITSPSDINQNQLPRGGMIISIGSSGGLGYAPLVGASVTSVVSGGSIVSVGLGTTDILGSGYNNIISIGVSVYQSGHSGTPAIINASVGAGGTLGFSIVNGGTGYTNPKIFVSPPSYQNLEVTGIYRPSIGNTTTSGKGLLLDVEVGASSTTGIGSTYFEVKSFNITRAGYGFNIGDVFTPVGLVTDKRLASPLSQFKLTVIDTFSDSFASWQFGEFDFIDSIKIYQDGVRTRFPLYYNSELISFQKSPNSEEIDMNALLFIVINGVIQDPGLAYNFEGGTSFVFTTPPKKEDKVAVLFYRGTKGTDSSIIEANKSLKKGDRVQVKKNNDYIDTLTQNERTVFDLTYSDKFETNLYGDQGIDTQHYKPLTWIKQKIDSQINGEIVYKSRESIEAQVYPTAKIIKDFSSSDTDIFVDNAKFFNYENNTYPNIKFDSLIIDPTSNNNNFKQELIKNVSVVQGFSGIVTGIGTTTGTNGNALALKFYLNSSTFSNLNVGYPIYVYNTSVGKGVTSINNSNSAIVGIGTTFLDNIYYIHQFSSSGVNGIITCNVQSTTNIVGIMTMSNSSNPVGKFSWGRLSEFTRSSSPISIGMSGKTVDVGLTTFSDIQRRGNGLRSTGSLPLQIL